MDEDETETRDLIRSELNSEQRSVDARFTIDPRLVNFRLIETLLGPKGMGFIDRQLEALPPLPDWQHAVRLGHIYTRTLLAWCELNEVPTLRTVLNEGVGRIFCSVETVMPCPEIYDEERVTSLIRLDGFEDREVALEYSTELVTSSTTKMELANGDEEAAIALFDRREGERLIFRPLVIGGPWLESQDEVFPDEMAMWWSHHFFENFIEDIDEFTAVNDTPPVTDFSVMSQIREKAFKQCLAEILGDRVQADWGGETSDHYSAHVHLRGRRLTAAFLLKGPAHFAPMGLNHLGKNNDQIYRLAQEPAQLLVVQHCNDILPAVRSTLRAFAVQPGYPRRYCLIDGRDSLRLLMAYDKLDKALAISGK